MIVFPGFLGSIAKVFNFVWRETQVLSGSLATGSSDLFGCSVSINSAGDRIIVGACQDERSSQATGQNEGLAYIFVSGTSGWTQQHILSGTLATGINDYFGFSVAMNSTGDRVVVGAHLDERLTGASSEGLAYIFVSGSAGWTQQHILSGSLATGSADNFGYSVAMNSAGDRVIVGAYDDEQNGAVGGSGLAYIFVSGATGWRQQHILSGTLATGSADSFGYSVSINSAGDRVIVGTVDDERSNQINTHDEGLAYMFVSGTGGWTQQHIFSGTLATQSKDEFGYSVSMNSAGDRVVIGATNDEQSGAGAGSGLAYIFVSGATGWTQQHILSGSLATGSNDFFGCSVSINSAGDRVVVGAYQDERLTGASAEGLAYIFVSGATGWTQQHILSGTLATGSADLFGFSVAMNSSGYHLVVGARQDERSSQATGQNEGLAYVFTNTP